ncbi:MAG: VanW family protein [Cellulosilyticaceae bacterium]
MTRNEKYRKQKHKRRRRILGVFLGIIPLAVIAYIAFIHSEVQKYDAVFAQNIWVNEHHIGGLTPDEARTKILRDLLPSLNSQKLTLKAKNSDTTSVTLTYEELGVTYDVDQILTQAVPIGHEGNMFARYQQMKQPSETRSNFTLEPRITSQTIEARLGNHLEVFAKSPVDATMTRKNRAFHITKEAAGYRADASATTEAILKHINEGLTTPITVPVVPVAPKYTEAYFKTLQTQLSSFSTTYNNSDAARNTNLELASRNINTMLMPGEKFMYSKQLEPITEKAGYKYAKVINNGVFEEGIGGGICQVSSTLYNAVLLTDLDIYMRRNHSLPVGYTPLGRDATYATNSVDFQFINNSGHPLYVESYCENNQVYVNIYGHKDFKPDYESKFESELVETLPIPEPRYEEDPKLAPGTEVVKSYGKEGKKVILYKLHYKDGKMIKKEKINTSVYKPQTPIIRRGPKVAPTP